MATLISKATGNLTDAATWSPISAVANAELDSEAGSAASTTSDVYSATFTPAATGIDGVAVKVAARVAAPTGTITITLANNTSPGTREGSLTLNVADLHADGNGWYFFKFGSVVTPNGTDVYKIGFRTSVAGEVTLFRNATAGNWCRMVRLTSAGSVPVAGDKLMIMGEWTGAGTLTSFTVTMDSTASTSYGPTVSGGPPQGLTVNKGGTLQYGVAASTNYYLRLKGVLAVYGGATFNIGTSVAPIPATSTAVLEFASVANVDSGLQVFPGGTNNIYGNTVSTASTLLTADKAAAATTLTVASTAGWAAGDVLCVASTTQTPGDCESKTILTVDSATQVTLTAGLTNAHSGTSPTQAEVGHLTRNVKIRGISATLQGYVLLQTTAAVTWRYAELTQLGSATANKRGVDCTVSNVCDVQYCTFHDSTVAVSTAFNVSAAGVANLTFSNNVTFNVSGTHFNIAQAVTATTWTIDNNLFIRNTDAATTLVILSDIGGTFTNNTMVGSASGPGWQFNELAALGTFSGNVSHSNGSVGLSASGATSGTISNSSFWRNATIGLSIPSGTNPLSRVTFSTLTVFGSGLRNIQIAGGSSLVFTSAVLSGDTTFSTQVGLQIAAGGVAAATFESCDFGTAAGIKTAHTTSDIAMFTTDTQITLRNTALNSATRVSGQTSAISGSYIRAQRVGAVGVHSLWLPGGTVSVDTAIYDTPPSSPRLTPLSASVKLESCVPTRGTFRVGVNSGGTVAVKVRVRKSLVTDPSGAAYNGNQPRLMLRKNLAAGIAADTVIATGLSANGIWETLSGVSPAVTDDAQLEFFVDCDGTAGWVNVGRWRQSGGQDQTGLRYWEDGVPLAAGSTGGAVLLL